MPYYDHVGSAGGDRLDDLREAGPVASLPERAKSSTTRSEPALGLAGLPDRPLPAREASVWSRSALLIRTYRQPHLSFLGRSRRATARLAVARTVTSNSETPAEMARS